MNKKLSFKRIIFLLLISCSLVIILFFPLPFIYRSPGRLIPASSVVLVDGGTKSSSGEIFIPTALWSQANGILLLNSFFNPDSRIIPMGFYQETPAAAGLRADPFDVQREESLYRAVFFALQKLGHPLETEFEGAQITAHLENSLSKEILEPGDVVIQVDDIKVSHQGDIHSYTNRIINEKNSVTVVVNRGEERKACQVELIRDHMGRASIGTYFQGRLKRQELPVKVTVDKDLFTGSSAGLPILLEVVNQSKLGGITKGRLVAATGTLDEFGRISTVSGVEYKVYGAERKGIDLFICPQGNYEEAQQASSKIKIIPVRTIDEALSIFE